MVQFNEDKQNKRLEELRHREEEQLMQMLSQKYGIQYLDISHISINTDALRLIPEEEARATEIAVINQVGKKLTVAVHAPQRQEVKDLIADLESRGYTPHMVMATKQGLERAWDMYKDISFAVETKAGVIDISGDELTKILQSLRTLDDVREIIEETLHMKKAYRISRILEVMLAGAIFVGSSDVHLEPEEERVRLRYRLDGVLTDIVNFDKETYGLMLSRVKLISGLKLNVKSSAQDGRFSINIDNKDTQVRTSVIPDAYGESIVLRLLNPDNIELELKDLGMEDKLLQTLLKEIKKPNGLIVTTGPTGSGKTTTLYAFMRTIHNPDIKIITIEDPVEYHLPGIVQTQIDGVKYTFSSGLRAALRQDPDIIMVGEIRDSEVAQTAIHSALTGHLVFSTLHTNNAAGAIPRLTGLGVDPKVFGSAVNVVMAQRLVRKLCEACKEEKPITEEQQHILEHILRRMAEKGSRYDMPTTLWNRNSSGCSECNSLGFKGRIGIYEAILIDEGVSDLITRNPSEHELMREVNRQGILTMRQDGILKVLHGITSLEEVGRVVSLDDDSGGKLNEDSKEADDIIQKALND